MKPSSEQLEAERAESEQRRAESGLSEFELGLMDAHSDVRWLSANEAFGAQSECAGRAFPLIQVSNVHCRGLIAFQGAQVLSFQPGAHDDLLWLSPNADFAEGKPVRGGIPVCLPWFGVNQHHPDYPKHGFARTSRWQLEDVTSVAGDATRLLFALRDFAEQPHSLFPHRFTAQLLLTFGRRLELVLSVFNVSEHRLPLSWALHSYHPVSDLNSVTVGGLKNCRYLDNTRGLQRAVQQDDLEFGDEFDRVYLGVGRQQIIHSSPAISVSASSAPSAIVWNPGARVAASITDLGEDTYRQFICLERGAAFDDAQSISARAALQAQVIIEPIAESEGRSR